MTIGLANSYETFLLFRLGIGVIGASFVITQYHTSVMFAPNVVGTANATTAGWGNLGGGVTQMAMPLILAVIVGLGASEFLGWRLAMVVPGAALLCMGVAYWRLTQDAPLEQEHKALANAPRASGEAGESAFLAAAKDHRVWALFLIYGACFGIELTMHNIAALYFHDRFGLGIAMAGLVAGLFGLMNLFARTLGGAFGDRAGRLFGLKGRTMFLGGALLLEGIALITFSQMAVLPLAIVSMLVFSLFVQMSEGATYSIVPFVNKRALGAVAGIVGAGGNVGAVGAGFLFRMESLQTEQALLLLGVCVIAVSSCRLPCPLLAQDRGGGAAGNGQGARQGRRRPGPAARDHGPVSVAPAGGGNATRQQSGGKGQGGKGRSGHPRGDRGVGRNPWGLGDAGPWGPGPAKVDWHVLPQTNAGPVHDACARHQRPDDVSPTACPWRRSRGVSATAS